jgi:hypothetical protein
MTAARFPNRPHAARYAAAIVLLAASLSCHRAPAPIEFLPYESLLQILADFAAHLDDDLYRFGYPLDVAGNNLYRATLQRLDSYEALHPGEFRGVIAVSRAQALERLGDYSAAARAYRDLGPDPGAELAAAAQQNLGYLDELISIVDREQDFSSLPSYLAGLERKRDDLMAMAERFAGAHYEFLARIEAEQADVQRVVLMFRNRYLLPGGLAAPLEEAAALIERHERSRLRERHILLLAEFCFTAARDYVALHDPERLDFDDREFEALIAKAQERCFEVTLIDGAVEKPEARAQLEAIMAYARAIRNLRN